MNNHTPHHKARFAELTKTAAEAGHENKLLHKQEKSQRVSPDRSESASMGKAEPQSKNIALPRVVLQATDLTSDSKGKIRNVTSPDLDANKSLADLRAILVGPVQQLHDARAEEFVSILEENDQANRTANTIITNRLAKISELCDKLVDSIEDNFRKTQTQAVLFDSKLQKMDENQQQRLQIQNQKLDSHSISVSKRLEEMTAEFGRLYDGLRQSSADDIYRLENNMLARIQDLAAAQIEADKTVKQLEVKLFAVEAQSEKLNRRNAEVFSQGFSDLAERFLNVSVTPNR